MASDNGAGAAAEAATSSDRRIRGIRVLVGGVAGARSLARVLRHLPDRVLHPIRRRRALRALASLGPVRKIVVLCLGNINRSAYAAALLRAKLEGDGAPAVISAGFIGPDRPSPAAALALAAERGIDLSAHRSQLVTPEILRDADLVLVMNPAQRRAAIDDHGFPRPERVVVLGDLDSLNASRREIRDPYDQAPQVYEASFGRIERCVGILVGTISIRSE
jgi:protein-tyrosine-phosphatase